MKILSRSFQQFAEYRFFYIQKLSEFNAEKIHQCIRKFGTISGIQLLVNKEAEAHVTFASDRSAYLVMLQYDNDKKANKPQIFDIQPADPWEQPKENDDEPSTSCKRKRMAEDQDPENEYKPEIFMLNDFCFLQVIMLLDLDSVINLYEACKKFKAFIDQHNCFKRFTAFTLDTSKTSPAFLNKNCRRLRYIGQHITDLVAEGSTTARINPNPHLEMLRRFFTSSHLQRAKFVNNRLCADGRIHIVAPILRNLESLEVIDLRNYYVYPPRSCDIDFERICPNLVKLTLRNHIPFVCCCKPLPRLKHISTLGNRFDYSADLASFIQQNPQLISLESFAFDDVIRVVADHVPTLEKLHLASPIYGAFVRKAGDPMARISIIEDIGRLQQLTEIKVDMFYFDVSEFEIIVDRLASLSRLRRMKLCGDNYDRMSDADQRQNFERSLIRLARQLNDLEMFAIDRLFVDPATIINFIRIATLNKLKMFFYRQSLSGNLVSQLVSDIVNALRLYQAPSTEPLKLFLVVKMDEEDGCFVEGAETKGYVDVNLLPIESETWCFDHFKR